MRVVNRYQNRIIKRSIFILIILIIIPIIFVYLLVTNNADYKIKHSLPLDHNATQYVFDNVLRLLSQSEMEMIEIRMQQRVHHLHQKCFEYGLNVRRNDSLHKPNPWEFLVNRKYHLIWCNVFKAASTSWMYNFNVLAGYSPEYLRKTNIVPLELARKKYPRVSLEELQLALNDSISFLIVRHPFERLISAYRNKIVFALPHSYHDKLGMKIVRKYRKKNIKDLNSYPKWPLFNEFVYYLLDEVKRNATLDMHWTPITNFCTPCQLKFDVIAKFETLSEDQVFLIRKAKLKNIVGPQWRNSSKGQNTLELIMKLFSLLTKEQIDDLYRLYKYDFELFGYTTDDYYKMINVITEATAAAPSAPSSST